MGRSQHAEDAEKTASKGCGEDSRQRMRRRQQTEDAGKIANRGCGEDSKTQGCGGRGDGSEMAGWWIRREKRWQYEGVFKGVWSDCGVLYLYLK